jgi:DNA-binding NarL/FixJ family response regulator
MSRVRSEPFRVLVVGEDPLARSGLATLLAGLEFSVVASTVPSNAMRLATTVPSPEVAAWAASDSPENLDRARDVIASGLPLVAILPDEAAAADWLGAGARGALLRDVDAIQLGSALAAVIQGNVVLDDALAGLLRPRFQGAAVPAEALTPREAEVLQLLALGLSNKEIAARLNVSEHTAKFHVNAILGKLGAQSRTEAVVRAARMGLINL